MGVQYDKFLFICSYIHKYPRFVSEPGITHIIQLKVSSWGVCKGYKIIIKISYLILLYRDLLTLSNYYIFILKKSSYLNLPFQDISYL